LVLRARLSVLRGALRAMRGRVLARYFGVRRMSVRGPSSLAACAQKTLRASTAIAPIHRIPHASLTGVPPVDATFQVLIAHGLSRPHGGPGSTQ